MIGFIGKIGCVGALAFALLMAGPSGPLAAKDILGPVTGKPMPRYIAIKAKKANARRGPSKKHKIDWVFQRRNLPVQVIAEFGHWRRVVDSDGEGGWIHYALLTGARHALVTEHHLALRYEPIRTSQSKATLEKGVVARIEECRMDWCEIRIGDHKGWVRKAGIWGVDDAEVFD